MHDLHFGKYTGIVKDNRDDQNLGQLKVSVPAIFQPDDLVTVRPALPYGFFFVPENGAKVWVEFEGGDPGLPLWTGVQYVPGEWPDEAKANPPQKRVIKTAAGHLIIFDDKDGEAGIEIKDGVNGHDIKLNNQGISVNDGVNNHSITCDSTGVTVKTQSGAKVQMTSSGTVIDSGTPTGSKVELTPSGVAVEGGQGIVTVTGNLIQLGPGVLPVIRVGDSGIGNLGAPVVMAVTTNTKVLA